MSKMDLKHRYDGLSRNYHWNIAEPLIHATNYSFHIVFAPFQVFSDIFHSRIYTRH